MKGGTGTTTSAHNQAVAIPAESVMAVVSGVVSVARNAVPITRPSAPAAKSKYVSNTCLLIVATVPIADCVKIA
jgi:hypothetical protein